MFVYGLKAPCLDRAALTKTVQEMDNILIDISYWHVWSLITNDINSYKLTTVFRGKESVN